MFKIISRKEALKLGLKKYFTGKPCINGHISERWSAGGKCFACHYEKNPIKGRPTKEEMASAAKIRARRWYEKNRRLTIDRAKEWKRENKASVRRSEQKWRRKKRSIAIRFMRDSLRRVLQTEKQGRTEAILGYTREELKTHIEKQFSEKMSWSNYGEWHIDHITPVSVMLSNGITEPSKINCLSNLRPIWEADNRKKKNNVEFLL